MENAKFASFCCLESFSLVLVKVVGGAATTNLDVLGGYHWLCILIQRLHYQLSVVNSMIIITLLRVGRPRDSAWTSSSVGRFAVLHLK